MEHWTSGLYLSTDGSDIELHIATADQQEIVLPGHSLLLRSTSKVFKALLDCNDTPQGQTKILRMKVQGDTSAAMSFLRFLYTRRLGIKDTSSYVSILHSAKFYEVSDLVEICEDRLMNALTPFSVCRVYTLLENNNFDKLLDYCRSLMLKCASVIFSQDLHLCLSEETMRFLLESNELNALDEKQVMCALWEWGRTKCGLEYKFSTEATQNKIAGLLPFIRWKLITAANVELPWFDMVSNDETESTVSRCNNSKEISLLRFANVLKFPSFVREVVKDKEDIGDTHQLMTFKAERSLLLVGIVLHVKTVRESDKFINYSNYLVNSDPCEILSSKENVIHAEFDSDSKKYYYTRRIHLEIRKPIFLDKASTHSISVKLKIGGRYGEVLMPAAAKLFNTKLDELRSDNTARDLSVPFCVLGPVTAVEKIFYFVN